MNDKLLSIKEFDVITSNESYAETEDNVRYLKERYFNELDDFIRNQESTDDEGNPLDFLRARTIKGIGNVIQAKNFVGLIRYREKYRRSIYRYVKVYERFPRKSV